MKLSWPWLLVGVIQVGLAALILLVVIGRSFERGDGSVVGPCGDERIHAALRDPAIESVFCMEPSGRPHSWIRSAQ